MTEQTEQMKDRTADQVMEMVRELTGTFKPFLAEMERYRVEFIACQGDYEALAMHPDVGLVEAEKALKVSQDGRDYLVRSSGKPGRGFIVALTNMPKDLIMRITQTGNREGKFMSKHDGRFHDLTPDEIGAERAKDEAEREAELNEEEDVKAFFASLRPMVAAKEAEIRAYFEANAPPRLRDHVKEVLRQAAIIKQGEAPEECMLRGLGLDELRDLMGDYLDALDEEGLRDKMLVLMGAFFALVDEYVPGLSMPHQLAGRIYMMEQRSKLNSGPSLSHFFHTALHMYSKLAKLDASKEDTRLALADPDEGALLN